MLLLIINNIIVDKKKKSDEMSKGKRVKRGRQGDRMRRQEGNIEERGRLLVIEGGRHASRPDGGKRRAATGGKSATNRERAASPRAKRRRRLARAFLAALAIGLIVFVLYGPVKRYVESRRALSGTEAELERERAETAELEARRERAKTEEFVEEEARDMGYVKPGEIPIIVIDEKNEEEEVLGSGEPPPP